jgi:hypothetical protein
MLRLTANEERGNPRVASFVLQRIPDEDSFLARE